MRNIALLSHDGYIAGAEKMLFELAIVLSQSEKYHPIIFWPKTSDNKWISLCKENNIDWVESPVIPLYIFDKNETIDVEIVNVYAELFEKYNISVLISNTLTNHIGIIAANRLQIPVVLWVHGVLDSALIKNSSFDGDTNLLKDRVSIALSDYVIFCSKWVSEVYRPYIGEKRKNKVFYNWTSSSYQEDNKMNESIEFVCLNTMEPQKGILECLKAVKILSERGQDFKMTFYGTYNQYQEQCEQYVIDHNLQEIVTFKEKNPKVDSIYRKAFCLIQPSYIESFGLTMIEAMAHKLPVIAMKNGGAQEILSNETGILVDLGDIQGLADAMDYLLSNREKAHEMGTNGYKVYMDKFSSVNKLEEITEILDNVINCYVPNSIGKELIYDILTNPSFFIKQQIKSLDNNLTTVVNSTETTLRRIDPALLSLNLLTSNEDTYKIVSTKDIISGVGVIFSSYDEYDDTGYITVRVFYKNKLIRESIIYMSQIVNNQWCLFQFESISGCLGKEFKILIQINSNEDKKYGIYEYTPNISRFYRIKRKLGIKNSKADILFYDLV